MIYRIAGTVFFILVGILNLGISPVPAFLVGISALIAGIALAWGK